MEKCWAWRHIPVIPVMVGSLIQENHGPDPSGKHGRPYLQNNQSKKGLEAWLKWWRR
jgi:hypothetical protein